MRPPARARKQSFSDRCRRTKRAESRRHERRPPAVRPPGIEHPVDLHQPLFDVDEAAIGLGVAVLVEAALAALGAVL